MPCCAGGRRDGRFRFVSARPQTPAVSLCGCRARDAREGAGAGGFRDLGAARAGGAAEPRTSITRRTCAAARCCSATRKWAACGRSGKAGRPASRGGGQGGEGFPRSLLRPFHRGRGRDGTERFSSRRKSSSGDDHHPHAFSGDLSRVPGKLDPGAGHRPGARAGERGRHPRTMPGQAPRLRRCRVRRRPGDGDEARAHRGGAGSDHGAGRARDLPDACADGCTPSARRRSWRGGRISRCCAAGTRGSTSA